MAIETLMQIIANGLVRGGVYILVALGLTLVLSIMNIVNFAHGQFYMLGAFVVYYLASILHVNFVMAIVAAMLVVGVFAMLVERLTFRHLRGQFLQGLIIAISLSWLIETGALLFFGPDEKGVAPPIPGKLNIFGAVVSNEKMILVVVCALLTVGLSLLVFKTKFGRAVRAIAQDEEAALMLGISVDRISALAFGLGCAIAAAAGGLIAPVLFVSPFMGMEMLIKALAVIILGGMGSFGGVVLGGLLLGFVESFGLTYLGYGANLLSFGIIVLVLLVRPTGFFGHAE
ncbi:branched-chain amino acid ABC transporter permease [Thermodesulfobacteriota bacterium]